MRNYLHQHEYANTRTADLFESLDEASEWSISEIMGTWLYQKGFPQIEATRVEGGVRLAQRRYLVIPDDSDTTTWQVPIQLRGSAAGEPFSRKVLLTEAEATVDVGDVDWVVANGGGYGFYRTQYSQDLFAALLTDLDQLDDVERYSLVSDTLAMVRNGQADAARFLDLVAGFTAERQQAIWSVMLGGLGAIEQHALTPSTRPAFEAFVRSLLTEPFGRLGWDPSDTDSDLDRKLRGDLLVALGVLGADPATIARCSEIVDEVLAGSASDPEVATAALAVFAHHTDAAGYDRLWGAYVGARTPIDEARYLRAVGAVDADDLATATFDRILDGSIRSQDSFLVFAQLLSGRAGPTVWRRATEHWDALLGVIPGMGRSRVVDGVAALSQPGVADEVKAFLAERPLPDAVHAFNQNLERLEANVQFRERETAVVTAYFAS